MGKATAIVLAAILSATAAQAGSTTVSDQPVIGKYTPLSFSSGGRTKSDFGDYGPTDDPSDKAEQFPQSGPKVTHQWPGTYFTAAFAGDTVYFRFDDANNNYRVTVGRAPPFELKRPGKMVVRMTGFSHRNHVIRVEKLTESPSSSGTFDGFFLPTGGTALAPPTGSKQVEIIGDSYAAGYGTLSTKHDCTPDEIRDTTDTQQAFGPLLAKHYDADYQVNAKSGIGMVRNYGGSPGDVMPDLYPYTLFDKSVTASDPQWQPQIVIIALGDNDFATTLSNDEKWPNDAALREDFIATYVKFVQSVRANNPRATFILMDFNELTLPAILAEVADRLKQAGETRVLLYHPGGGDFEQTGCDWHLSLNDHKRLATGLETFIDAQPGIWGH